MRKILFLTPYVPSSRAGGENFTRLLLEELSKKNKIDLLYYRYADDPSYVVPNENVKVIKEIINSTALMRSPDDTIITQFDLHDCEDVS